MKIQYASDLHLEFPENKKFILENPIIPVGDILILAGDIVPLIQIDEHKDFFDYVSDNFRATYWIPGNHEYYYTDIADKGFSFIERIRSNVFLLNNKTIIEDGVKLIFSTLWSKISKDNEEYIQRKMNDFYLIEYEKKRLTPKLFNFLHEKSLIFLKNELTNKGNHKTFVVTHHLPTYKNYPQKYSGKILNEAFTVELHDFIIKHQPDYWLYGHIHYNTPDFNINKSKIITNQLGYVFHNEHELFSPKALITI